MAKTLTTDQWIEVLHDPKLFNPRRKEMLRLIYEAPGKRLPASVVADRLGLSTITVNSELAKHVGKPVAIKYDLDPTVRSNQKFKYWDILFDYEEGDEDLFVWILRPELSAALEQTGIVQSAIAPNEPRSPRYWTAYWQKEQAENEFNSEIGFNHTGVARTSEIQEGDVVYGISNARGMLRVLGRMEVGLRTDLKSARKLLGYEPWGSEEHLIALEGTSTPVYLDKYLDRRETARLLFIRKEGIRPPVFDSFGLEKNTLRKTSQLTPESARILDKLLGISPPVSANAFRDAAGEHEMAIPGPPTLVPGSEGGRRSVTITVAERSTANREICLRRWGYACAVCKFDFGAEFGYIADGYIHVHHHNLLAESEQRVPDPETEMSPLCPNCHAVAHLRRPPYRIDELKKLRRDKTLN